MKIVMNLSSNTNSYVLNRMAPEAINLIRLFFI